MDYVYFEDFVIGQITRAGPVIISAAEMIAFAQQFDPQPMHIDPQAAEDITGGLIASGWHTACLTMRMFFVGQLSTIVPGTLGLGIEKLSWHQTVRPNDALSLHMEIIGLRSSNSRPGHGIVTAQFNTTNQRGETVLEMTNSALTPKRSL